ncbi:MAG: hypothetical protein JO281_19605 [Pseudonocardiales bacterium]|nr:hypothetical protein [Pseudonocardiales bacterium]
MSHETPAVTELDDPQLELTVEELDEVPGGASFSSLGCVTTPACIGTAGCLGGG